VEQCIENIHFTVKLIGGAVLFVLWCVQGRMLVQDLGKMK
jgi:hypothetical protein